MTNKISGANYFLKGKLCTLVPMEEENMEYIANLLSKWVNDEIVTYYMFTGQIPLGRQEIINILKRDILEKNIIFVIKTLKTKSIIGYCGLYDIHKTARKAEFRILIGERNFWGKGIGREVCEMVTFYGFDRLNLNRIYLGYTSENKAAARAYSKAGYEYEGKLKEDIYRNSQYYDSIKMGLLRKDYYQKYFSIHKKKFKPKPLR